MISPTELSPNERSHGASGSYVQPLKLTNRSISGGIVDDTDFALLYQTHGKERSSCKQIADLCAIVFDEKGETTSLDLRTKIKNVIALT